MAKLEYDQNDVNIKSLRARVFDQLQNDIINGKYRDGDNLIETRLSEEMGVSRTPIREAITQLELEGLVKLIPNKGAIVKGIKDKDVEDIYTIRMRIEGLAARWAAKNINDTELYELKEICDLGEFYTKRNDLVHIMKVDTAFHELVLKASGSVPLLHMLKTFHHYTQKAREHSLLDSERALQVVTEHRVIYAAIASRDGDKAEKLMNIHVRMAWETYLKKSNKS